MSNTYPQQLLLGVRPNDEATFENFYQAESNRQLLQFLTAAIQDSSKAVLFIWSGHATGKTHLQQAICHSSSKAGNLSFFLPMKNSQDLDPSILTGLEFSDTICIDDVDAIAGNTYWEEAVFNLYNRVAETDSFLVFTGSTAPKHCQFHLPDLHSRVQSSLIYQLHSLTEQEKFAMFKMRAEQMGINIGDAVIDYILVRSNRDLPSLLNVLSKLDLQSLEQKRLVTIPLVKQTMGW